MRFLRATTAACMVRSLAPGKAKPRQRLQRAVREAVKETARSALMRILQTPSTERTDEQLGKLLCTVSQFSFFATLDGDVTREVCRFLTVMEAQHEQVLCRQGEVGDCMYFIMEGAVNVMVRTSKDESSKGMGRKVDMMREGSAFGQLALVSTETSDDSRKRTATCCASGPCALIVLFRDDYQRLVAQAVLDAQNKLVMALRTVPSLSGASRAELLRAAVMMRSRPISYRKGDIISPKNVLAEQLQFLEEGTLVVKAESRIVRQVVLTSMYMVGAISLLRDESLDISIIAGSDVSGYTLPPHLARKLLANRSVTTAVEVTHREEQAMYAERVEKLTAAAQLRSSLIASSIKSTQREKEVHPAVRLGRCQLFPNGKSDRPDVPQPPNYRSPKSFKDDTAEAQQVRTASPEPHCARQSVSRCCCCACRYVHNFRCVCVLPRSSPIESIFRCIAHAAAAVSCSRCSQSSSRTDRCR